MLGNTRNRAQKASFSAGRVFFDILSTRLANTCGRQSGFSFHRFVRSLNLLISNHIYRALNPNPFAYNQYIMKSILVLFYPLLATVVASEHALEQPAEDAILGSETVHGCYASLGDLQLNGTYAFNSLGSCASTCNSLRAYVAAVQGESCYCGSSYPAANTLVDDSQCTEPCPGYAANACGGTGVFTVINTGLKTSVTDSDGDSTGSDVTSPLLPPAVVT